MKYLAADQIIKSVKEYIEHAAYDYAIMIDGEWGCGKSFLARNELTDAIKEITYMPQSPSKDSNKQSKYEVIAISLYGIADLSTLSRQISVDIISKNKVINSKVQKVTKKVAPLVGAGLRLVTDIIGFPNALDNKNGNTLATLIQDFSDLKKFVFIFDDLERSSIPITEVLGFISNLVEVNGVKTIIIANEKEIKDTLDFEDKHHRITDLAAVLGKPVIPKADAKSDALVQMVQSLSHCPPEETKQISFDELKNLADSEFPLDGNYKRIKEKVVGQTLFFGQIYSTCYHLLSNAYLAKSGIIATVIFIPRKC